MAGRPKKNTNNGTDSKKVETKTTNLEKKVEVVNENVVENKVPKMEFKPITKKAPQLDRNRMVLCRSVVYGRLTYVSPITKLETNWSDYGDMQWLETSEIIAMNKKFLTKPWLLIEDYDELIEFLRIQDIYNNLIPLENIEEFLTKPFNEIEALYNSAPMGMKQTFAIKIGEMVHEKKINDIRIVNMIDKTLGTGLKEFI
jgi:hypothetical protein